MTRTSNHYTLTNREDNASVTVVASVTFASVTAAMAGGCPAGIGCLNTLRAGPRFEFRPLLNEIVRL